MNKLLIVGTVAFDAIETPMGKTDKILGGGATYIGLSSAYFPLNAAVVSIVGNDFPQEYLQLLEDKNIDISSIEIVKDGKTFFWSGKYHNNLNNRDTLDTQLNVLTDFNPIVPENYKDAEVVMLGNIHPSLQISVLNQMNKKPRLAVLDTMGFWMDCALSELKEVLKRIDVIIINDEEARQLSQEYSLVKAAEIIQAMGPKTIVIKKGEHGALLFQEEEVFFAPALPLKEVFDPTGAGDTFAGGFSSYMATCKDYSFEQMKTAVIYGSVLASFCVEKFGTQRMQHLTKADVDARLEQFNKLTKFTL